MAYRFPVTTTMTPVNRHFTQHLNETSMTDTTNRYALTSLPTLDYIYEGFNEGSTTSRQMVRWVEDVAAEYGVGVQRVLAWANRDRLSLYAYWAKQGDPIIEDHITYWRQALDNLLARNRYEDVRNPGTIEA